MEDKFKRFLLSIHWPFTGQSEDVQNLRGKCSEGAFVATKESGYSSQSTSGTGVLATTTTTYVTQTEHGYNHCVGCHLHNQSKHPVRAGLAGSLAFLLCGIRIAIATSAEKQDELEGSLSMIYALGLPSVLVGAAGLGLGFKTLYSKALQRVTPLAGSGQAAMPMVM
eukprot:CAMPEP_0182453530 /NCGR_PEP_ID=MMETSP1319-20130603/554_1 /TAXON_ID=172717 /ORGANISM="Bolidomonas pacifica, Strain RCC208" /LENGTH=166 /DNA_ID=CAMNT_0024651473 /DNA_START=333 /DNA_END=831 /DNA_ORIENTATION=-